MKNESAELKAMRDQRDKLEKALRQQTDYLAATHGVLRTLPIPSMHAFEGARRYSEVLTPTLNEIADSVAASRAALASIEPIERQATVAEFMGLAPYPERERPDDQAEFDQEAEQYRIADINHMSKMIS